MVSAEAKIDKNLEVLQLNLKIQHKERGGGGGGGGEEEEEEERKAKTVESFINGAYTVCYCSNIKSREELKDKLK